MKAAVVEKIGLLQVRTVSDPVMGDYDALCEILYGATCAGTDLHVIAGKHPRKVYYPTILGHESIGRVIEVGKKVKNFKAGDLVARVGAPAEANREYYSNWGGFAEYGIAKDHWRMKEDGYPAETWIKSRVNQVIPEGVEIKTAPMIITWRETYSYMKRMGLVHGKSLLILGSGANALSFINHACNMGLKDIVMVGSGARQRAAEELGATDYLDYRSETMADALSAYSQRLGGFDYIIDAIGRNGLLSSMIKHLKKNGVIGVYGFDDYRTNSIVLSHANGSFLYYNNGYDEAEVHEEIMRQILQKKLKPLPIIDTAHPYELDRIQEAYGDVERRKKIKALIRIKGE